MGWVIGICGVLGDRIVAVLTFPAWVRDLVTRTLASGPCARASVAATAGGGAVGAAAGAVAERVGVAAAAVVVRRGKAKAWGAR